MYRHAIITDGKVSTIIIADDNFTSSIEDTTVYVHDKEEVQIGHLYDHETGLFSEAPVEIIYLTGSEATASKEAALKTWRDSELSFTDYIVPITDMPNYDSWMSYRQALRDWPNTENFPDTKPIPDHLSGSIDDFIAWNQRAEENGGVLI
jgi:hypothetical protein